MFPPCFCLVKCLGLIRFVSSESQSWMQRPGMVAGSCFACEPFQVAVVHVSPSCSTWNSQIVRSCEWPLRVARSKLIWSIKGLHCGSALGQWRGDTMHSTPLPLSAEGFVFSNSLELQRFCPANRASLRQLICAEKLVAKRFACTTADSFYWCRNSQVIPTNWTDGH